MNPSAGPGDSISSPGVQPGSGQPPSWTHKIFMGPNGIRPGWRILIFLALVFAIGNGVVFIALHTPGLREHFIGRTTSR